MVDTLWITYHRTLMCERMDREEDNRTILAYMLF